jgi:copper(I)-binding protein
MNLSALVRPCARPLAAALSGCLLLPLAAAIAAAEDNPPLQNAVPSSTAGRPVIAGDLQVSGAWARATVARAPGAVYFTVTNRGRQADTLLGATSPVASNLRFHQTMQSNGMSHMRPAGELVIAPSQVLKVEPTGLHLMLDGLRQPLAAGTRIPLVLEFRRAGSVSVQVDVMPIASAAPVERPQPMPQHHAAH